MIKKINITLGILCLMGALFIGGIFAYDHFTDAREGKLANKLMQENHYVEER